jgi:hypothetical protein
VRHQCVSDTVTQSQGNNTLICAVGAIVRAPDVQVGQAELLLEYHLPLVPLVGSGAAIVVPAVSTASFYDTKI